MNGNDIIVLEDSVFKEEEAGIRSMIVAEIVEFQDKGFKEEVRKCMQREDIV